MNFEQCLRYSSIFFQHYSILILNILVPAPHAASIFGVAAPHHISALTTEVSCHRQILS